LVKVKGNIWLVRRKDELYFFRAEGLGLAKKILGNLKLSWFDEEEVRLFTAMSSESVSCLNARLVYDPMERADSPAI